MRGSKRIAEILDERRIDATRFDSLMWEYRRSLVNLKRCL